MSVLREHRALRIPSIGGSTTISQSNGWPSPPKLALWRDTMLDAALYRQWLINLGRRAAHQRIAHLLCEIWTRLQAIGRAQDAAYELPITQSDLADAVGFSLVHVNKSLKRLREDGLITFRANEVRVHDWERLRSVAGFDPAYLQLRPEPSIFPSNYVEASDVS